MGSPSKHSRFFFFLSFEGCSNVSRYTDIDYFPNGNIKKEFIYRGNVLKKELVKIIQYYPTNQNQEPEKQFELSYSSGAMNELQKYWYKNGKREMELSYQNGFKHGKQKGWYENGNPILPGKINDFLLIVLNHRIVGA